MLNGEWARSERAVWSLIAIAVVFALTTHTARVQADEGPVLLPHEALTEFFAEVDDTLWSGLALGSEGDIWFVEDGKIVRMSSNGLITGEFIPSFGEALQPYAPLLPSEPGDLALGADHRMWFTDASANSNGEHLIGYVTPTGEIQEFPISGSGVPLEIAPGPNNTMWFTENDDKIGRVTEEGAVTIFKLPSTSGEFSRPLSIAEGSDGNMWVAKLLEGEDGQYTIDQVTPLGHITPFPIPVPYRQGMSLALGPDGNIWFTQAQGTIGRITPAGTVSEFPVSGVGESFNGLIAGPDGDLWFTEGSDVLGRITPTGVTKDFLDPIEGHGSPTALALGREGYLWYLDATGIGRLRVPLAPTDEISPTLAGDAVEGQVLSVDNGSWSHDPSEFRYQWQICDGAGAGCADLAGQDEATHVVAASDVGHTLRAVVTAGDEAGENAAVSVSSAVVRAAARSTSAIVPTAVSEAQPVVGSAMTWSFGWTRKYTIVESLVMHEVPVGSTIEIACHGHGCRFTHWRTDNVLPRSGCGRRGCVVRRLKVVHGELDLTTLFKGWRLRAGAHIAVGITRTGWVGKSFVFTTLVDRTPRVLITCLSSDPGKGGTC